MTTNQLTSVGIPMNKWVTLENKFCNMQLWNDGHLYPVPECSQYYFDSANELLFVRYTFSNLRNDNPDSDWVYVDLNNGSRYLKLLPGGQEDKTIGRFHEVFTFESITSLQ